jgi:hypothetical protein
MKLNLNFDLKCCVNPTLTAFGDEPWKQFYLGSNFITYHQLPGIDLGHELALQRARP